MEMTRPFYDKLVAIAKYLNDKKWVEQHHRGNIHKAAAQLTAEHKLVGIELIVIEFARHIPLAPDYEEFCELFEHLMAEREAPLIASIGHCEMSVDPSLSEGTTPDKIYAGECYRMAANYAQDHDRNNLRLIHGNILSAGNRVLHAWVEIHPDIVFDGVLQRFYRKQCYYETRNAQIDNEYTWSQAQILRIQQETSGPWT